MSNEQTPRQPLEPHTGSSRVESSDSYFERLISSPKTVRTLSYMARSYSSLFETAKQTCDRLRDADSVCFLLDFDVIRNYVEVRSQRSADTYAINYVLESTSVPYGIPLGAYEELVLYLRQFSRNSGPLLNVHDQESAVHLIAHSVTGADTTGLTPEDCADLLSQELDECIVQLERLIAIIQNCRFQGFHSAFDESHFEGWLRLLTQQQRDYSAIPRSDRDVRDAKNLAIASQNIGTAPNGSPDRIAKPVHYELVTQTRVIRHLLEYGEDSPSVNAIANEYFGLSSLELTHRFPVIHPRDAVFLALLDVHTKPGLARTTAREMESAFRRLDDSLEVAIEQARETDQELYEEAFRHEISERRAGTRAILKSIANNFISNETLFAIESARTRIQNESAIRLAVSGQRSEAVAQKSSTLARLMRAISNVMASTSPGGFSADRRVSDRHTSVSTFAIRHTAMSFLPELNGEVHHPARTPDGLPVFWRLRWEMHVVDKEILTALSRYLSVEGEYKEVEPRLTKVSADSAFWQEGIVLHTSFGDYGMSLSVISGSSSWLPLSFEDLGRLIRRDCERRLAGDSDQLIPDLEQIRVNTAKVDVLIDVTGGEARSGRYISFIARQDTSCAIAQIYAETCGVPFLSDILSRTLRSELPRVVSENVRTARVGATESIPVSATKQCKILYFTANPDGTTVLQLEEEVRTTEHKIRSSTYHQHLQLIPKLATRPDDLIQAMNDVRPHIVHFSAHGTEEDEILLLAADGSPQKVRTSGLEALFGALRDNIRVVVLNACYTQNQADAITRHIDFAIGVPSEIPDLAAIIFASSLYRAIGFGCSLLDAFNQGIAALALEGFEDDCVPVLRSKRGCDPSQCFLV